MRVLLLCPIWLPMSPNSPGGIETFLPGLAAGLARLGCDVTVLASGDSAVDARLMPSIPRHLNAGFSDGSILEAAYHEQHVLGLTVTRAREYDIVHCHVGAFGYALSFIPGLGERVLHTHHGPVYPDLIWFARANPQVRLCMISRWQARKLLSPSQPPTAGGSFVNYSVVHNGISCANFPFSERGGDELLFIGRMEEGKGPDLAIETARTMGRPLVLAGPIIDKPFFSERIEPFLTDRIRYVGVVNHARKTELYGRAGCTLLPFRHEEGFGMVMVESMACGTPVVALANGAAPEVIDDGLSGYTCANPSDLPHHVEKAMLLDRLAVRERVIQRFDISASAKGYLALYDSMLGRS